MDETKIIYHGSNVIVQKPKILINGHYKDFGYGFYCTNLKKQAKRWALTKRGESVVNSYVYTKNSDLKICSFEEMTEEWLEFVVNCRRGKEHIFLKRLSGNWLNSNTRHIRSFSARKKH